MTRYPKVINLLMNNGNQVDIEGNKMFDLMPKIKDIFDGKINQIDIINDKAFTRHQKSILCYVLDYANDNITIDKLRYKLYNF